VHADDHRGRTAVARDALDHQRRDPRAVSKPADRRIDREAEQPGLAERVDGGAREGALQVDLVGGGCDDLARDPIDSFENLSFRP